ncbi:60S ribosomal protein L26 [Blastocystis sp. subtype 4]|uniref:60S ribosomal protein L26 n=2 Tax=Blastocystis sp. subtype 4 TaxID=944170 RepID=UPI000711FD9A|nr:60S ribosomal protein L26 [Blastocystis sp. subtype 4]KNB43689.1 60S ribosomal protein L26 [Blastocystis sp. subtype 4]|eukprot:XP_014527132.1 60S ribosomal protein L26 [Blastocystis sp. subtype 4]
MNMSSNLVSSPCVSSSRRTTRKAHFTAPSHIRRVMMSSPLSKALKDKYNVNAIPVVKGDKVKVTRGSFKGREGKVTEVYRRKWVIHIEGLTREKVNGSSCKVGVDASKVEITELKLNKDRQNILERKAAHKAAGKYTEKDVNLD